MNQTDELKALRDAKGAAVKVTQYEQQLRARHTKLLEEREGIAGAYRSLEEILADKDRLVDEACARWAERCALQVVLSINGHRELRGPGSSAERDVAPELPANRYGYPDTLGFEDLCALVPSLMKARLAELIRGSGATFGLPDEARTVKLAELDAQIAEIEQQHTELVDGAAEVGIRLPLLDTVRVKRDEEALRIKREQALAAERAAGIYAVTR